MKRKILIWSNGALLLMIAAPLACAGTGSWSSESFGGEITHGKQWLKSRPIQSMSLLPRHAQAKRLVWKIKTDAQAPLGFRIRFCSENRCVNLPTQQGEIVLPAGIPAAGPFRFEYYAPLKGPFLKPLTVLSNQVTISYHFTR